MPLIYNGQEAGNERRLAFFDKDPIVWREHPIGDLYKNLLQLQKANSALWNGAWGAPMIRVPNDASESVISFVRQNDSDKVFAAFNFSDAPQQVTFNETLYHGEYMDFRSGERVTLDAGTELTIAPWGYEVFVQ
jgi:glycosidase